MTGVFLKPTMGFLTLTDNNNNISRLSKKTYEKPLKQVQCASTPKLDKEKIRLLVIGDTEKGRIPYFDSNAILRLDDKGVEQQNKPLKSACKLVLGNKQLKDSPGCSPSKNGVTYQFHRLGNDVKVLEEMMFGTVGTAYKGSTLKIHHMRSSSQLMVTKVFYPQKPKADSSCVGDVDSDSSGFSSSYAEQLGSGDFLASQRRMKTNQVTSIPVDVPQVRKNLADSMDEDTALASLTSSGSFQSMFPSPSNSSASSYNSLHRRWMRSQTTSLQSQARRWNSQETLNSPEGSQLPKKKQCKLAVGIVFLMTDEKDEEHRLFQSFFFSHMALIEGHVEQLRSAVERGFFSGRNLVPVLFEALDRFKDALHDLYMAPRLQKPVWLSMMSLGSYRYVLCDQFVHEFMALATKYDNKSYKFFVSTLISAVLTYHLAWVATVTPGDGAPSKTYLDKHSAKWVDTLAKTHPYNPLWAQLGDLYGAIGQPPKVARTVVVGRKADVVNKFLYVLSYFIRCSDVREVPYSQTLSSLLEEQNWEHSTIPSKEDSASTANMPESNQNVSFEAEPHSTQSRSEILDHSSSSIHLSSCLCPSCSDFSSENCSSERTSAVRHDDIIENRVNKETQNGCVLSSSQNDVACSERMGLSELNPLLVSENESNKIEKDVFCILSPVQIKEQIKVENVQHVRRSAESDVERVLGTALHEPESKPDLSTKRPLSLLAQQLAIGEQREKLNQARNRYQAEGSNSMFEEYFEEGIEVKVIDDICEQHLLVSHPLVTVAPADTGTAACCTVGEITPGQQKTLVPSRQNSVEWKPLVSGPSTFNPGRCRSVMPAELNRRRHLSSTGSLDLETFDPLEHCQEMPMLSVELQGDQSSVEAFDKNFGRSLLAGFSDHYMSDFVLHGTSDTSFRPKLMQDLQASLQHSVLDEPVAESVCIIADTDSWTVEVASSRLLDINPLGIVTWTASQLVTSLTESMLDLNHLKMSSEFCIMHLEDRMQELYFKSLMLAEYIKGMGRYNLHHLNTVLGFDASDIPLLLAIAGTHTPNLALGI